MKFINGFFDFNGDGKISSVDKAGTFFFLSEMEREEENEWDEEEEENEADE